MSLWAQVGFYSSLGFILPAGAAGGFGLGWLVDRWLHTWPAFAVIMSLVGAAGGLVEILRILSRAEKRYDPGDSGNGSGES
jgi:F0F1-type ATP synthase assembly protein I